MRSLGQKGGRLRLTKATRGCIRKAGVEGELPEPAELAALDLFFVKNKLLQQLATTRNAKGETMQKVCKTYQR